MPQLEEIFGTPEQLLARAVGYTAMIVSAVVAYFIAKQVVLRAVEFFVRKTAAGWDDVIVKRGVFNAVAWLAPALVAYYSAYTFATEAQDILQRLLLAYMQVVLILVLFRFLDAASDIYNQSKYALDIPIKGYIQIFKIVASLVGGIVIFGTVVNRSPWGLISGLGALTAVLLILFRDTLLSFVASILLNTNDMVRIGDWITFPKYDADGDVIDIALHTVKIQNFDKTITTIPTHRFIEDAFKNWRGMRRSGGRRIKRAIYLDMTSIRFLDPELEAKLSKIRHLRSYLADKKAEIAEANATVEAEASELDRRRLTNLGTFRAYVREYLRAHPEIHERGMTFLVRQLAPGPHGVGLELYVFSKEQSWAPYEQIQADIMDHLLAIIPIFDLRVFQNPTGNDFAPLVERTPPQSSSVSAFESPGPPDPLSS